MIVASVFATGLGWVVGIHMTWWLCIMTWAVGYYLITNNNGGLGDIFLIGLLLCYIFANAAALGYTGIGSTDLITTLRFIFTGDK